jgi:23S rRNA (pseudouridine1915-N3)-methyltransferase
MLKINIISVGINKESWVEESIAHFLKPLKRYANVSLHIIPDIKNRKNMNKYDLMLLEAEKIDRLSKSDYRIGLTDKGRPFDSLKFAELLNTLKTESRGQIDFIIGGIYGLHPVILDNCRLKLSLSPMTMSHQLIRPVLLEQLYRGFSIIAGTDYHK